MLQKLENASISFVRHKVSDNYHYAGLLAEGHISLSIGKTRIDFPTIELQALVKVRKGLTESDVVPYCLVMGDVNYWVFKNYFYKDSDGLTVDDVKALLIARERLRREQISRARTIATLTTQPEKIHREAIPDDIKLLVWERDNGKCKKCGSNINLQYDHMIPYSLGGASTPENLQILCGTCNRLKSASVI